MPQGVSETAWRCGLVGHGCGSFETSGAVAGAFDGGGSARTAARSPARGAYPSGACDAVVGLDGMGGCGRMPGVRRGVGPSEQSFAKTAVPGGGADHGAGQAAARG